MRAGRVIVFLCAWIASCDPRLPSEPDLYVDFESIDSPTAPLGDSSKTLMNGVYAVVQGGSELGELVVGTWVGNRFRLASVHDAVYAITAGGHLGDSIKLRGYLRVVRSGGGGRINLKVAAGDGGREVIGGRTRGALRITGEIESGVTVELRWLRTIAPSRKAVLAHRGGGRNSDRLGVSENSIEMIRYSVLLGATGVEVDVKRTRDNQLILFHDETFSPRTVQGVYLLGKVENYDLAQIRSLGKLIHGEQIPTLDEALAAVVNETDLSVVWLDIKDPGAVPGVVESQRTWLAAAARRGRSDLRILLGIPTAEVLAAYRPFRDTSDALLELEAESVLDLPRCRVWAPVWTRDIPDRDIAGMRDSNREVYVWTVDLRGGILQYLPRVDGILSNYPTLVGALRDAGY